VRDRFAEGLDKNEVHSAPSKVDVDTRCRGGATVGPVPGWIGGWSVRAIGEVGPARCSAENVAEVVGLGDCGAEGT